MVPGCDALLTHAAGTALLVRTADCLPLFFAEPRRGVVGLAHAGWRGLAASLPARVVAAFRHLYHVPAEALAVAIGPAIRACCYEVGPEFAERFGPFVQQRGGRRTCDLIGAAREALRRCGVRPDRVTDTGACTACDVRRWFSLRREGPATGRLTSIILLRP
jgi:YfiH family protein